MADSNPASQSNGNPAPQGGILPNTSGNTAAPHPQPPRTVANIIAFGETGVGKSSLIKMLRPDGSEKQPKVSGDARGCTTNTDDYLITIGDAKDVGYCVWDTPGLSEGREGAVAALEALLEIHGLVQRLIRNGEKVDLLIYCIRASRFRDILRVHYDLVAKTICKEAVPVVAVVTGLENEENMDGWWEDNEKYFNDMKFKGHACVTTTKGKQMGNGFVFEKEYQASKSQVQRLIQGLTIKGNVPLVEHANIEKEIRDYMARHNSRVEKERGLLGLFSKMLRYYLW